MASSAPTVVGGKKHSADEVAVYVTMLKENVSQLQVSDPQLNIFGSGKEVLTMCKANVPLLTALFRKKLYPQLTMLTAAIAEWSKSLGPRYSKPPLHWSRHQSYAVHQQLMRMRKLAHNATTGSRIDKALLPLVTLLKEKTAAAQKQKAAACKAGALGRKLLRRVSSSPKPAKSQRLSLDEMQVLFGTGASSYEHDPEMGEAGEDTQADEVEMLQVQEQDPAEVIEVASSPDQKGVFWNAQLQTYQFLLPSGKAVNLKTKETPPVVQKKPAASLKRPAAAATSASTAVSAAAPQVDVAGTDVVERLLLTKAASRKAAYITAKVRGAKTPKLLVELTQHRSGQYLKLIEQIMGNLNGRLAKAPEISLADLKAHALQLREELVPTQG